MAPAETPPLKYSLRQEFCLSHFHVQFIKFTAENKVIMSVISLAEYLW